MQKSDRGASRTDLSRFINDQNEARPAIIFIHGLGGSVKSTWKAMYDCFSNDPAFSGWALDTYSYPTSLFSYPFTATPPGLHSLADGLATFIDERHANRPQIILVAHSLGGLVCRQYIVSNLKLRKNVSVSKLVLIAVPNTGAALATLSSVVSWHHRQLKTLCKDNNGLRSLNVDWEYLKIEELVKVRYILGGSDRVVDPDSAYPHISLDNKSVLIESDHRSIISPTSFQDIRYQTVRRFIQPNNENLISNTRNHEHSSVVTTAADDRTAKPNPLFEVYNSVDESFYVERNFDRILSGSMSDGHVWLTGESGVGKTACLRRAAFKNGWQLNHLNLGGYSAKNSKSAFHAICTEFSSLTEIEPVPHPELELAGLFAFIKDAHRAFPTDLVLATVIEEIPLDPDELCRFGNDLSSLLESLAVENDLYRRVVFAISSINEPRSINKPITSKSREHIQFIPAPRWSETDISHLIRLLSSSVAPQLTLDDLVLISKRGDGSPRYVKQVFRHLRRDPIGNKVQEAIALAEKE